MHYEYRASELLDKLVHPVQKWVLVIGGSPSALIVQWYMMERRRAL